MGFWQMWSLQWTENPQELVRIPSVSPKLISKDLYDFIRRMDGNVRSVVRRIIE